MEKSIGQMVSPGKSDRDRGYECLIKSEYNKNGVLIEGHDYVTIVAFHDKDTGRWYAVVHCRRCGYPSVAWTDRLEDVKAITNGFEFKQEIGG